MDESQRAYLRKGQELILWFGPIAPPASVRQRIVQRLVVAWMQKNAVVLDG